MNKLTTAPKEVTSYVEILSKRLYFAVLKDKQILKLRNNPNTLFFCIDNELLYENYYFDFGPLNISCFYKYCFKLKKYLQIASGTRSVVHYTSENPERKANAACLIGCFCVIYLNFQPKEIWCILQELGPYKHFLDASQMICGFNLKILDCIQAVHKAAMYNLVNFKDFNVAEYDLYNKLQYGDMNWLVPRKFLAFIGPAENYTAHPPEFYLKYFLKNDIKTVIRLNNPLYNPEVFTQLGIQHYDLIFPDGSNPPKEVLMKFLAIAETAPAAIGVHCKAGLGRTGSLIGAYMIKHYNLTAREVIAWMRLCRPGSVIGQQQIWLEKLESWLWKVGIQYRLNRYGSDKIQRHKFGIYSKEWPIERERIILDARSKLHDSMINPKINKLMIQKSKSNSIDSFTRSQQCVRKCLQQEKSVKNLSKLAMEDPSSKQIGAVKKSAMNSESSESKGKKPEKSIQNNLNLLKQSTQGDNLNKIKASWENKNYNQISKSCLESDKFQLHMASVS